MARIARRTAIACLVSLCAIAFCADAMAGVGQDTSSVTKFYSQAGLYAKLMSFIDTADPLLLAGAFAGLILLVGLAIARRWHALFLFMIIGVTFSGSVWQAADSLGALVRWLVIALMACGVLFAHRGVGKPMYFFGGYVAVGFFMCLFSPLPIWSIQQGGILFLLFLSAITLASTYTDEKPIARTCFAFIVGGIVWAAMGAISLRQLASGELGAERFSGTNISPGVFVQTGGLLLPFVLWGALRKWNAIYRAICFATFVTMIIVLISSAQRSGTFAGFIACVPLLFRSQIGKMSVAIGGIGLSFLLLYQVAGVNQRHTEFVMSRFFSDTTSHRTEIWEDALAVCLEDPVFGRGFGANKLTREDIVRGRSFHSMYLVVWYDCGVPGLLFFGASIVTCGVMALKLIVKKCDEESKEFARLSLGLLLGLLAHGLVQAGASSPSDITTITLVTVFGITTAVDLRVKQMRADEERRKRFYLSYWYQTQQGHAAVPTAAAS